MWWSRTDDASELLSLKRKLIEVALPLEAINIASAREKSIRHGHPSTLHLWWARRPLAACRAVLFASLVDDPSSDPIRFPTAKDVEDERTRLFEIIQELVQWDNSMNKQVLDRARAEILRSTGGSPPAVLDPFCGGGSIPLEAQRLNLIAYASDLNPVAVLITKALIEIPPRFANMPPVHPDARRNLAGVGAWTGASGLAEDIRRYGSWIYDEAVSRIGHLYPKVRLPTKNGGGQATAIAWIWARTVTCPNPACGARMPLVRSFALSTRRDQEAWIEPIVDRESKAVSFEIRTEGKGQRAATVGRQGARCLVCEQPVPLEHVRSEGRAKRMGAQLMAIVAEGARGRVYLPPDLDHVRIAESAMPVWEPDDELATHPQYMAAPRYGLTRFRDLFTARQLVALTTFSDLVTEARLRVHQDATAAGLPESPAPNHGGNNATAYADAIATYLAFVVDRVADRHTTIATWDSSPTKLQLRGTFARQAIPMTWDFGEGNPFSSSSGTLRASVDWVAEVVGNAVVTVPGSSRQEDASRLSFIGQAPLVSTDPPYYDNVPYADLSDFFYVWLRRTLGSIYPNLFSTLVTPKSTELVADSTRFGGQEAARDHFERGLSKAFERIRQIADPRFPVTVYYAFKQTEREEDGSGEVVQTSTGWETMLEGLLKSGFSIDGTWPMRSELGNRMRSIGSNALASSIVLVCRPRLVDAGITSRKDFVSTLKAELPEALRTLQHGNIAPVDLAQASIGPGIAIFSRFAKVLEPDGSAMPIRTALALINQALGEILSEQEDEFDADTRWAIAWYEQFGLNEADSGRAILLTQAKNTSLHGLVTAGIVEARRGETRLLSRSQYTPNWDPVTDARIPVWEATQRLVHALLTDGEAPAGELLSRLGGLGDTARDLAYRLYQVAEKQGWTDEARAYNALVIAWPDLVRRAEQTRRGQPAQASLGLET
jgi:putative DNA methylase